MANLKQEPVLDLDGHVVRQPQKRVPKPKAQQMTRDEEIARLNEKIEFLARTNMLYSDWEHREAQVTSDLIRKGIEEAKINVQLRAEIESLKAQLAQPAQEPVAWVNTGELQGLTLGHYSHVVIYTDASTGRTPLYTTPPQRPWVGLTDAEQQDIALEVPMDAVFITEAKLKERNHGT